MSSITMRRKCVMVFLVSMLSVWWVEKNAVLLFPHSGAEYRLGANIAT